jgi:hypothetical protein
MTYTPSRDYRFEYIHDAIHFIEENQCRSCTFKKDTATDGLHAVDYPMCYEVEGEFYLEEPMDIIDDRGDAGIVCLKYRNEELANQEINQGELF